MTWIGSVVGPSHPGGGSRLLVEYVAKPSLEARKDRIPERERNLRELRAALRLLTEHEIEGRVGDRSGVERVWTMKAAEGETVAAQLLRCEDDLPRPLVRALRQTMGGWEVQINPVFKGVSRTYEQDEFDMGLVDRFLKACDITIDYIGLSTIHRRARRRLIYEAIDLFDARFVDPPTPPSLVHEGEHVPPRKIGARVAHKRKGRPSARRGGRSVS